MRDIRKPSRSSRSNINNEISHPRKKASQIAKDVEMFEKNSYSQDDIYYDNNGKPIMKASSHFDVKIPSRKSKKNLEPDVLDRNDFFKNLKRDLDENVIRDFKNKRSKKRKWRFGFLYIGFTLVLIGLLSWTFLFDTATVNVSPKYKDVDVSDTFLFFKDDLIIDNLSTSMSKEIMKSAPKEVKQKATGEITIFNNYSNTPQILIKNTRFQTSDGKIFRLDDSVTVPGKNGNTPGSIVAKVSADTYGPEYNIGATDFTIPGFKGTARFTAFTAKSKGAMKGGISGTVSTVSPEDIASTNNDLKGTINTNLSIESKKINHENYFSLYNSLVVNYTDNQDILMNSEENNYTLNGNGVLFSIKKDILAKMIAGQVLKENFNPSESVHIDNIDDLIFTVDPNVDMSGNIIKILINGKARIIWSYDKDNIRVSLAGQSTNNFSMIMNNYSNSIIEESFSTRPTWIKTFPSSPNRINIKEILK